MALQGSVNLTKNFKVRKPSCDIARGFACCPSLDNKAPSYLPALSSVREPWKLLFESRTPIGGLGHVARKFADACRFHV